MSFLLLKKDDLVTQIDNLSGAGMSTVNGFLANNTPSSNWLSSTLEKLAANIMTRYDPDEIDDMNSNLTNFELEVTERPSPPSGAGRIWTNLVQLVSKL